MTTKKENYSTWDEYFMGLAMWSSTRSKDPKSQVGACIVNDEKRIISNAKLELELKKYLD